MPTPESIDLAPWLVALIGGTLIPLVTGFLTKQAAHPGLKAAVSLALVAVLAAVDPLIQLGHFDTRAFVSLAVSTFVMTVATYYGVWKPVGNGTTPTQALTPDAGLG